MKNLIFGAVAALAFSTIAHADPFIECPPDSKSSPGISISTTEDGTLQAVVQDEQNVSLISEEHEGFEAVLKAIANRDCKFY
ncbi:hypothetical protein [Bdellovibrio sp. HCB2-146]|uniref:hypothetical protein n=1 Tax=Bdellovibrio sp. HCB2-146 TaxID=3394362 RepID=UPI0039BD51E2